MSGILDQFDLNIGKFLKGTSNGKAVVPMSDANDVFVQNTVINETYDFFGFTHLALNPVNNDLCCVFDEAQGHGVGGRARQMKFSRDGGLTWEAAVDIGSGVGGPHIYSANGQRIYNYRIDSYEARIHYTDDEGQTFSDWVDVDAAEIYSDPGQLLQGGEPIRVGGDWFKPFYGREGASGHRTPFVIKTTDEGVTHSFLSFPVRTSDGSNYGNPEEPCLIYTKGVLFCYFRTGDAGTNVYVTRSVDLGRTWDKPRVVFNSWARPGCGVSPNGTILILGGEGDATRRATFAYSNDLGETHSTGYLDERDSNFFTYGTPVWHAPSSRFVACYSSDTNFPNGPAHIICKFLNEV